MRVISLVSAVNGFAFYVGGGPLAQGHLEDARMRADTDRMEILCTFLLKADRFRKVAVFRGC